MLEESQEVEKVQSFQIQGQPFQNTHLSDSPSLRARHPCNDLWRRRLDQFKPLRDRHLSMVLLLLAAALFLCHSHNPHTDCWDLGNHQFLERSHTKKSQRPSVTFSSKRSSVGRILLREPLELLQQGRGQCWKSRPS